VSPLPPRVSPEFREVSPPPPRAPAPQRARPPARGSHAPALAGEPADIASARKFARWFDTIPIDPLIGLVAPGVGDVLGSLLGLYIVGIAVRRKLPAVVIARMLVNLAADAAIGAVPLLGDLGDLAFKANRRNVDLLVARAPTRRSTWRDWAMVAGAVGLLIGALVLAIWLTVSLIRFVF
jgi:hypothetical protein